MYPALCDPVNFSPPGTSAHGISRQEYSSWLPFPSPGGLPDLRIEPRSPALQTDSLPFEPPGMPLPLFDCCYVASVVFESVRPHRWQPTRLLCSWDSPGKNTRVGFHFLLQCMKVKSESEVAQSCLTLSDPMDCSLPGFSVHGIFQARVLKGVAIAFSLHCMTGICLMLYYGFM